jgi:hypothetical protein
MFVSIFGLTLVIMLAFFSKFFNSKKTHQEYEIGFSYMSGGMGGGQYSLSYPVTMSFEDMVNIYVDQFKGVLTNDNGKWVASEVDATDLYMLENKISKLWVRISIRDLSTDKKYCIQYYIYDSDENKKKEYGILVRQTIVAAMNIIEPIP